MIVVLILMMLVVDVAVLASLLVAVIDVDVNVAIVVVVAEATVAPIGSLRYVFDELLATMPDNACGDGAAALGVGVEVVADVVVVVSS